MDSAELCPTGRPSTPKPATAVTVDKLGSNLGELAEGPSPSLNEELNLGTRRSRQLDEVALRFGVLAVIVALLSTRTLGKTSVVGDEDGKTTVALEFVCECLPTCEASGLSDDLRLSRDPFFAALKKYRDEEESLR